MKKTLLLIGTVISLSLSAQSLVDTTQAENKNVFIEEYTGRNCPYCPDGHKIANDIKVANPNDVVLMRIHTGGYAPTSYPDFNTSFGPALAGQSGITGYPTGTVNRHIFSGSSTSMSRSAWSSSTNQVLSQTAVVNIGMNAVIDTANRNLFVEVELYYTGDQSVAFNRVNVAVLQDNIAGSQSGGQEFNSADVLANGDYNHKHILRQMLMGTWGDKIDTIIDGTFVRKTVNYTLPESLKGVDVKMKDLDIVAYVIEDKQEILNVTHMKAVLGSATGVEKHTISPLTTYPNPTNDKLNVEFEVRTLTNARVELINMLGQSVINYSNVFSAGSRKVQLDVNHLESGFYLLKVSNGKTTSSSKVIIK